MAALFATQSSAARSVVGGSVINYDKALALPLCKAPPKRGIRIGLSNVIQTAVLTLNEKIKYDSLYEMIEFEMTYDALFDMLRFEMTIHFEIKFDRHCLFDMIKIPK